MLILLISIVLLVVLAAAFEVKEWKILNKVMYAVCILIVIITALIDPLNLDRGSLKFVSDEIEEPRSIERLYSYVNNKIGGVATTENIVSKLEELNLKVQGELSIDDIDETLNGYTVKFTDAHLDTHTQWTLYFYKNDNNDILKTLSAGDIIVVSYSEFNNLSFDRYGDICSVSFKNCEVKN